MSAVYREIWWTKESEMRIRLKRAAVCLVVTVLLACAAAVADVATNTVSADQALEQLIKGNEAFVSDRAHHLKPRPVGGAQTPIAAVVSCADARVPPEILFHQGVNSLFVVRVAGNTVGNPDAVNPVAKDTIKLQSLAYAVEHLKVNLIVVLGHQKCGAVNGALGECGKKGIGPMFQNICPAVLQTQQAEVPQDQRLQATIANNVRDQVNLIKRTTPFSDLIKAGTLKVVGGVYDIGSGKVDIITS
jgi:carbonic anhydrase